MSIVCAICGEMSPSHTVYVRHMKNHIKGYRCMQCGHTFLCGADLTAHIAVHAVPEDDRPDDVILVPLNPVMKRNYELVDLTDESVKDGVAQPGAAQATDEAVPAADPLRPGPQESNDNVVPDSTVLSATSPPTESDSFKTAKAKRIPPCLRMQRLPTSSRPGPLYAKQQRKSCRKSRVFVKLPPVLEPTPVGTPTPHNPAGSAPPLLYPARDLPPTAAVAGKRPPSGPASNLVACKRSSARGAQCVSSRDPTAAAVPPETPVTLVKEEGSDENTPVPKKARRSPRREVRPRPSRPCPASRKKLSQVALGNRGEGLAVNNEEEDKSWFEEGNVSGGLWIDHQVEENTSIVDGARRCNICSTLFRPAAEPSQPQRLKLIQVHIMKHLNKKESTTCMVCGWDCGDKNAMQGHRDDCRGRRGYGEPQPRSPTPILRSPPPDRQ